MKKNLRKGRMLQSIAVCLLLLGCVAPKPLLLADCDGARHAPFAVTGEAVHVIVFVSHECPIANGYAPSLRSLHQQWLA